MGSIYKRKRRSCAMCKPHKMGWEPKRKLRERELLRVQVEEMVNGQRR